MIAQSSFNASFKIVSMTMIIQQMCTFPILSFDTLDFPFLSLIVAYVISKYLWGSYYKIIYSTHKATNKSLTWFAIFQDKIPCHISSPKSLCIQIFFAHQLC